MVDVDGKAAGATDGVDRRTFVKGALVGAAAGAAGAGGLAALGWAAGTRETRGYREARYFGAKVVPGSPTDIGTPLVPILVDGSGTVHGRTEDLRPHFYCQRAKSWPGAASDYAGDDALRYALPPGRAERFEDDAARRERWWFYDRLGERINVADFRDVPEGEGAMFTWRSSGTGGYGAFYGVLLKIPRDQIQADGEAGEALRAAMDQTNDLVAFDAACTHFCCAAGWHEDETAKRFNAWDTIFCTCHMARFDPRELREYSFELRPEDERSTGT